MAAGSGGSAGNAGSAGQAGTAGELMTYCWGSSLGNTPGPIVDVLTACDVEAPCAPTSAQLAEGDGYHVDPGSVCLLSALAERRVGRYLHETDSVWTNGDAGAFHTLVVRADGSVSYVREMYGCVESAVPVEDPPWVESYRCSLKPASYFEACVAAIDALENDAAFPPEGAEAWACAFGDGDGYTPNNLFWFESCASELPPRCE